jgi:hypothetical protein
MPKSESAPNASKLPQLNIRVPEVLEYGIKLLTESRGESIQTLITAILHREVFVNAANEVLTASQQRVDAANANAGSNFDQYWQKLTEQSA